MSLDAFRVPVPRPAVMDPNLARPDWTVSSNRPADLLWLDKNENTDPALLEVTSRVLSQINPWNLAIYPDCAPVYRKLANYLGVKSKQLLFAAGSDGVIRSVFETFVNPGDVVIHTEPTFAMYPVYARMFGARTLRLLYGSSSADPQLSMDEVLASLDAPGVRVLCLPNPDSPTGTVLEPERLEHVVRTAAQRGVLVLVDEAYFPFYDNTCIHWTSRYPNLVVARTFAKAWGLAGIRMGFGVAHPNLIELMHKVRPMYEVNTLAVAVLDKMLDHVDAVDASVQRLNEGKAAFLAAMEALGLSIRRTHGNFCHVAFGPQAPQVHEGLKNLVLYRRDFPEPCLRGYSRFSTTTKSRFMPVIERIRTVYANIERKEFH